MTGKTITVDSPDGTSVSVVQQPIDDGLNVGGVSLNTDLPWYGDAFIVLVLVALIYTGKKVIDKLFEKSKKK